MPANPFESPQSVEPPLGGSLTVDGENRRGRGAFEMCLIGAVLGAGVAVVAGAAGAALLSVLARLIHPVASAKVGVLSHAFDGAILGAFAGIFPGACLGAILGPIARLRTARIRRPLMVGSIIISALVGAATGFLGAALFDTFQVLPPIKVLVTGILCGGAAGILGGWILARLLTRICWGQQPSSVE